VPAPATPPTPIERLAALPRVSLAHLPTPLEEMPRLAAHLGGPRLFVKRDDCTGLGLGGNKVRKLEYDLAAALAQGADCIVCGGVVQSNVARQVAAACAKLGLECHLGIMHGRVPGTEPGYDTNGNILLDRLFCTASASRSPPAMRARPMACQTTARWKRSVSQPGWKHWRSIPSTPERAWPA
jgi:1-aminocyclopropane-1-carboxylate deaminase/D-cysteine desulfhydrase-like pyridoxal-dependent ACC family enzyme